MSFVEVRAGVAGLLLLLCAAARIGFAEIPDAQAAASSARPNIVFIMTDDEDVRIHRYMPKTKALIEDQGVAFENYFVTYSFCCPSRATTLTGQYAHNHRVMGNLLPTGGTNKFRQMGHESRTVAVWLQEAGYRTGLFGKYMNNYEKKDVFYVPPGWDEWIGGENYYFDYVMNENGTPVRYGDQPEDYFTDVLARHASDSIRRASAADEPFFLYITPSAPHAPATAAPRHADLFADTPYPFPPSFDEGDVSDKPSLIRDLPPLEPWQREAIERHYRERLRSLQAVDDMVETIIRTLEETGELDNTYIIYTSDNGWHMGEHRQFVGKTTAYEEDIRVPFVMRGPGVPKGKRLTSLVVNTDLAPTFAAIAGATPNSFVDGRSFLPLLSDPEQPWRVSFGIERGQIDNTMEITGAATFHGLRTADWTYVDYGNGERELYDLRADPYQLENIAGRVDSALLAQLSQRAAELANCAGSACRELEDAPIIPLVAARSAGKG
jgi:arylsulfatase A-like enzyme